MTNPIQNDENVTNPHLYLIFDLNPHRHLTKTLPNLSKTCHTTSNATQHPLISKHQTNPKTNQPQNQPTLNQPWPAPLLVAEEKISPGRHVLLPGAVFKKSKF